MLEIVPSHAFKRDLRRGEAGTIKRGAICAVVEQMAPRLIVSVVARENPLAQEKSTADYGMDKNSAALTIFGFTMAASRKSLSPVNKKSTWAANAARRIGLSFASRIFFHGRAASREQRQCVWEGLLLPEMFPRQRFGQRTSHEIAPQFIDDVVADNWFKRRHQ